MAGAQPNEWKVFITGREARCEECKQELGAHAWIVLEGECGARCLACAELEHLVFLPSGDAAFSRRARRGSALSAVVLKWSRARKQFERQGLLVEPLALERAEAECLSDSDARARHRERAAELDAEFVHRFAARVRALYPRCPPDREQEIAEHACLKYSGRVGRSAAAKALDDEAIHLAVQAHVRHRETGYDALLQRALDRVDARGAVRADVEAILARWRSVA
ncbi:MAG TPA: DUF2293 domain-containing protein [Polyangia bacterium]|nr:DUF2293 domain-containing protein [Polyangia bacterium]